MPAESLGIDSDSSFNISNYHLGEEVNYCHVSSSNELCKNVQSSNILPHNEKFARNGKNLEHSILEPTLVSLQSNSSPFGSSSSDFESSANFESYKDNTSNESNSSNYYASEKKFEINPPFVKPQNYDTSSFMYGDTDDFTFAALVNCDEVMNTKKKRENSQNLIPSLISSKLDNMETQELNSISDTNLSHYSENAKAIDASNFLTKEGSCRSKSINFSEAQEDTQHSDDFQKSKITPLQKRALDLIFTVTDRPSRGLLMHISSELNLHNITIKNFFSNARRRIRRAAAKLNDPDKARRESLKRKEKRKWVAFQATKNEVNLAASALEDVSMEKNSEPVIVSPERKALMEKLADKVQRSVAQKEQLACIYDSCKQKYKESSLYELTPRSTPFYLSSKILSHSEKTADPKDQITRFKHVGTIFNFSDYDVETSHSSTAYVKSDHNEPFSPTSWQTLLKI